MKHTVEEKIKRFWGFVDIREPEKCWLWTGAKAGGRRPDQKYGSYRPPWSVGRENGYAHRISYEIVNGPIPEGMQVLHTCDIPLCANPTHLFLGTPLSNAEDKVIKNRQSQGSDNGGALLAESDIAEIYKLRQQGWLQHDIATRFHVSRPAVSEILAGRRWKHVIKTLDTETVARVAAQKRIRISSMLTVSDVKTIRDYLAQGISQKEIAAIFNVHRGVISRIQLGQTWKNVI